MCLHWVSVCPFPLGRHLWVWMGALLFAGYQLAALSHLCLFSPWEGKPLDIFLLKAGFELAVGQMYLRCVSGGTGRGSLGGSPGHPCPPLCLHHHLCLCMGTNPCPLLLPGGWGAASRGWRAHPVSLGQVMGNVEAPLNVMLGSCAKGWYPLLVGLRRNGYSPCWQEVACPAPSADVGMAFFAKCLDCGCSQAPGTNAGLLPAAGSSSTVVGNGQAAQQSAGSRELLAATPSADSGMDYGASAQISNLCSAGFFSVSNKHRAACGLELTGRLGCAATSRKELRHVTGLSGSARLGDAPRWGALPLQAASLRHFLPV